MSAPSLADLDHDGVPEIVVGPVVFNADGTRRWDGIERGGLGRGVNRFWPVSAVADIDRDGSPEVVAGRSAYRADGTVYWNAPVPDGFTAVGDFDDDPTAEVVVVASGSVYLLEHDGAVRWGPVAIPGGGWGGAPTIADMDGDGRAEIGVAGAIRYVAFKPDGTLLWQQPIRDASSSQTGSSVFDFDGDGMAEVVYGDEQSLRIFRGTDGAVLYDLPKSSCTALETPVVADVDGDGRAEIVAAANVNCGFGPQNGIYVIGDRSGTWVPTRKVWNQYSYHVTNVNDDGTVPAVEANGWEVYSTYRLNVLTQSSDTIGLADLVPAAVTVAGPPDALAVTVRVENTGFTAVNPGVVVAFYGGDPARGGQKLGTQATATILARGKAEDVTFTLAGRVNDLWVRVDEDDAVGECDEANNATDRALTL